MKQKALALMFIFALLFFAGTQLVTSVNANPSPLPQKPPQIYIRSDGSIEPSSAPIQQVGSTYTLTNDTENSLVVQRDNIIIDGNGFGITQIPVDTSGLTIPAGWYPGIQLTNRTNVTIQNVKIHNCVSGVSIENSTNITLTNNSITNIEKIVVFSGSSSNCTFLKNGLRSGDEGILLIDSKHIDILENTIASNGVGISCYSSTFPSKNDADGVSSCAYINMFGNTIASNFEAGISLRAYYVRVGYNTLANNKEGIRFASDSYYTLIYQNNFMDNSENAKINILASGGGGTWVWDSGSSGNYWSDYTTKYPNATQIDHTGVGDTPYVIDAYNKDNYPLMKETSINPPYTLLDFPSSSPSASPSPTQTTTSTPTPDTSTPPTDEPTEPAPAIYLALIVVGCGVLLATAGTAVLLYHKRAKAR